MDYELSENYKAPETAFLYCDGKFYFGSNHTELMNEADLADEWGSATRWYEPHNLAMGWIWNNKNGKQTAEFFSDNYQYAQDSSQFDKIYKELKKKFPDLSELSFGPDRDAWEEISKEPDWMEQYLPSKEADYPSETSLETQIIGEIVNYAWHGKEPDEETLQMMTNEAYRLRYLRPDEMRVMLQSLLLSENPSGALELADECGLLDYIIPELGAGFDFNQNNPHHIFTLGQHSLAVLKKIQSISTDPDLRLAALLHDIGKPDTYWEGPDGNGHFYSNPNDPESENHEDRGADMAREFMSRLNYPEDQIEKVENIIRNHMWGFYSTPRGARRFINKAGDLSSASDLLDLREADLYGKGLPMNAEDLGKLEMSRALYDREADINRQEYT